MLKILVFLLYIFSFSVHAQIKDTIFGKPKFIKEYVEFLELKEKRGYNGYDIPWLLFSDKNSIAEKCPGFFLSTGSCAIDSEKEIDQNGNVTKANYYILKNYQGFNQESIFLANRFYSFKYDVKNRLISTFDEYDNTYYKINYDDDTGIRKYIRFSVDDGDFHLKVERYDKENKILYRSFLDDMGFYNKQTYIYDKIGNNIKVIFKSSDKHWKVGNSLVYGSDSTGVEYISSENTFDKHGNIIREQVFTPKDETNIGKLNKQTDYIYDNRNMLISKKEFNAYNNSTVITEFEYDNNKNMVAKKKFVDKQKPFLELQYKYNGNRIIKLDIKQKEYKKNYKTSKVIYKYKFDKQKNWTEIIKNVDGKDLFIWKREIQYY